MKTTRSIVPKIAELRVLMLASALLLSAGQHHVVSQEAALATDRAVGKSPPEATLVRVVLVGDSTMASYAKPPADRPDLTGWGQVLQEYFDASVKIDNLALSGRSSKSFIDSGYWTKALEEPSDYVLIQFGHNDSADDPKRATDPKTTFRGYLDQYIDGARKRGAKPILVTPVASRSFRDGAAYSSHRPYADAMIELGKLRDVPVLDLNKLSVAMVNQIGEEAATELFASETDRTHFSSVGARAIAELFVRNLPAVAPELATRLRK
ncbi:MAG: rhamnogalacturonan acetylesterase [Pirellulaceae bacterium]